jgi:hypothetical protein
MKVKITALWCGGHKDYTLHVRDTASNPAIIRLVRSHTGTKQRGKTVWKSPIEAEHTVGTEHDRCILKISVLRPRPLTAEEKERFEPMLMQTWHAIAGDCEPHIPRYGNRARVSHIVELVCDANRPEMYGKMSRDDYDVLSMAYSRKDAQAWLRDIFRTY